MLVLPRIAGRHSVGSTIFPQRWLLVLALGLVSGLLSLPAWSQTAAGALAGGPLKLVVPYPPGGSSDRAARLLAEALQPRVGVPVVVENRTGAGGRLAAQQLRTEGSANVLMLANPAVMVVAPLVFKDNGYDPDKDFVPVSQLTRYEFGLAVGAAVPVREVKHLLAWMKANADKASIGVPATGSLPHFFGLMLGEKTGVQAPVIGYRGSAPLITDLIGGHVPVAIDTLDSVEPSHKAGKLKILAVSGEKRTASLPDVPTFRESGIELSAVGWNVLYAPAGMPNDKVQRLAADIANVMSDKALQAKFIAGGMEPVAANIEQTTRMLAAYKAQWAPVVQRSGFQSN